MTATLLPPARIHFSSHAPFFYPEAALSKLDAWQTDAASRTAVAGDGLLALLEQAAHPAAPATGTRLSEENTP